MTTRFQNVMLIDDNEIDNMINQKMIESAVVAQNIFVHSSAKSAIEFLKNIERLEVADKILPDVIFLDIDMPLMDGLELARTVRLREKTRGGHIPIIALSAGIPNRSITRIPTHFDWS